MPLHSAALHHSGYDARTGVRKIEDHTAGLHVMAQGALVSASGYAPL
jgi:hypothetical protein